MESTPRVNAQRIVGFIGRNVLIVGRVAQLNPDSAVLDSASSSGPGGKITVSLPHDTHLMAGHVAQVVGKVNPDLSVKTLTASDLGERVDLSLYDSLVEISSSDALRAVFPA